MTLEQRKRPDIGLLIIVVTGLLFWSCVTMSVISIKAHLESQCIEPGPTCEDLRDHGWDVTQEECVRALSDG